MLMSQKLVDEMVFSTELAEYGCRRWPYDSSMGEVSSRLGMALSTSSMGLSGYWSSVLLVALVVSIKSLVDFEILLPVALRHVWHLQDIKWN